MKFDYEGCIKASTDMSTSANRVTTLIEELETIMKSIQTNYVSDSSTEIMTKLASVKAKGPEFVDAVEDCAKYLRDEVAPSYQKLEQKAAEKVNG